MTRWQASVLAGLGVAGLSARADDFEWRPVGPAAAAPSWPAEPPRPPAAPPPAAGWQSLAPPASPVPAYPFDGSDDVVFRPATVLIDELPAASPPQPVAAMFPVIPTPPIPVPVPSPAPVPARPTEMLATPRPMTDPATPSTPAAQPTPAGKRPLTASPSSAQVWGGYGADPAGLFVGSDGPAVVPAGGPPVPARNRVWGSEPVTLSRDYRFRDVLGSAAGNEARDERLARWAVGDGPATDRFLIQTEYLLWWVQPAKVPALATTGPAPADGTLGGVLGQAGTQTLLGPGSFGSTARNGFRVRGGVWFDDHAPGLGVDGSYFFLGRQGSNQTFSSDQYPVITRPFFAPNAIPSSGLPGEFGERVAGPGRSTGTLSIDNTSDLWGADINLKCCVCRTCNYQSAWFAGFRYLDLKENLTITENINALAGNPVPPGTAIVVQDSFTTRNRFYGGQVGYSLFRRFGRVTVDGRGSLAMGPTVQDLDIVGGQRVQAPGQPPQFFTGGLLATGPNLGHFSRTAFSVVPEVTLNLGYQITPTVRAYVGYNFLYWSNVIRPGDQIDRVVDLSFVPNVQSLNGQPVPFSGQARPRVAFNETDLWVQGIQFGAELRW